MAKRIESIEGIGPAMGAALRDAGIGSVEKLLEHCCDKTGRAEIARQTQISETKILKWVNMADLFRINGIASQYAELLEGAGVDTVKELRNRNAQNLTDTMNNLNGKKGLVRRTPSVSIVNSWIEQARELPPKISH